LLSLSDYSDLQRYYFFLDWQKKLFRPAGCRAAAGKKAVPHGRYVRIFM